MDWTSILLTIFGTGGIGCAVILHILNRRKYNADVNRKEAEVNARETTTATELHEAAISSALEMLEVMRSEKNLKDTELHTLESEYDKIEHEIDDLQSKLHDLISSLERLQTENEQLRRSLVASEHMLRLLDPGVSSERLSKIEGFTHESYSDSFFTLSLMPVAYMSRDGNFIEYNTRWLDMLGYTQQEHIDLTWRDITHVDDHVGEATMYNALVSNSKIQHYTIRKRYMTKDNTTFWANLYVRPIWIGGTFRHFVKFVIPVTKDVDNNN